MISYQNNVQKYRTNGHEQVFSDTTDQEQQLQHGATATLTKNNTNKTITDDTTTTATDNTFNQTSEDNCNLLYLATALNLPGFIHVIFQWVDANPHAKLVKEVDCQAQDSSGYTPLVSTCTMAIRVVEFSSGEGGCTELEIVLPENQHTQRK